MWMSEPFLTDINVARVNNFSLSTIPLIATPDWRNVSDIWWWSWNVHVYTVALLFYLLSTFCILSLFRGRKRLKKKTFGVTLSILFAIGIFRGSYFVLDPYGSNNLLPVVFRQLLFDITYPCLTTSYSLVQIMILRITKVDVGPTRIVNKQFFLFVTTFYFVCLTVVDISTGIHHDLRLLLLLPNAFFIIWSIYLSVTFIYNGFKLTHYVAEIKKARKELSSYSLAKRSCSQENMLSRSATTQRLTKPQIRITDEDNQTYSIVSEDESTMSDLNELAIFSPATNKELKTMSAKVGSLLDSRLLLKAQTADFQLLAEDSVATETTLADSTCQELNDAKNGDFVNLQYLMNENCSMLHNSDLYLEETLDETEFKERRNSVRSNWCNISAILPHTTTSTDITDCDESYLVDNGYMADTEVPTSCPRSKKHKNKRKCSVDPSESRDADSLETPLSIATSWHPKLMVSSPSTLSLHRIRQSRMLHRVMRLTYNTTFLLIVACLFQLYSLFGIYGLFSRIANPDPWPWLVFQTFYRFTELGMSLSMTTAVYLIVSYKCRTSANRKPRYRVFQSVENGAATTAAERNTVT
ncbi:uncharacterized protein LOC106877476 [Octopus bimaculoides]|uniref:uncharacterized protein LOC106877476 n=1 Tax=Octopus bimaculoides TaxID=37653 RepID=UPI00071D3F1C|nr:uncharacterized protein LOC106877476 [Octopus bimaculoides]|eukprot:XP_014781867.1 PREDICTED: uncharacterized protein LOC106877476 [Octopus bimaculoides]